MMRSGYRKHLFRRKAERPLLLLFPGCCDDAASAMRIRKGQVRAPSSNAAPASARGEPSSSIALADESHLLSARAGNYTPLEVAAPDPSSPALQKRSPTPPIDRQYMNLDEFVSSLARKNCFPDEETYHKAGESSGLDDHSVDTCLRLAISPQPQRITGGHVDEVPDDFRRQFCNTTTAVEIGSTLEAGKICTEAHGKSSQATSVPEPTETEVEAGQPDQTMKSSTESMERRPRRASRFTGKRERAAEEQEEDVEETSDHSSRRTKTRKRKRKKGEQSSTQDQSEKKPSKKKQGTGSSRSGRPKKLKYMKQENTEELGNQCNRSDGKGWTCPLLAKTGYQLCDHHLDKLRCKPGSRSKYNKSKKKRKQQQQDGAGASTLS